MTKSQALPMVDLSQSSSQLANNWNYTEGKGFDKTRKTTSQLLHFAGMEAQDIFKDPVDPLDDNL